MWNRLKSTSKSKNNLDDNSSPKPTISNPDTLSSDKLINSEHTVSEHNVSQIYLEGFINGSFSDLTIRIFGKKYKLHKIILSQCDFFKDLLSPPCYDLQSDTRTELPFYTGDINNVVPIDQDDYQMKTDNSHITQNSFELMLKRLYGAPDIENEKKIPLNMMFTGNYFGFQDSINVSLDSMNMEMVVSLLTYTDRKAWKDSDAILRAKLYLLNDGWENGPDSWDGLPSGIVISTVVSDCFFVPNEYDRVMFIIKLIERMLERKESASSIQNLRSVLNDQIIYCNISGDRLVELKTYLDKNGEPYIRADSFNKGMTDFFSLQSKIIQCEEGKLNSPPVSGSKSYPYFTKYVKHEFDLSKFDAGIENICPTETSSTSIPPIRVSFNFTNVASFYSKVTQTERFFYAGSYWNVIMGRKLKDDKSGYSVFIALIRFKDVSGKMKSYTVNNVRTSSLDVEDSYKDNINYSRPPKNHLLADSETEKYNRYNLNTSVNFMDNRGKPRVYATFLAVNQKSQTIKTRTVIADFPVSVHYSNEWEDIGKAGFIDSDSIKVNLVLGLL